MGGRGMPMMGMQGKAQSFPGMISGSMPTFSSMQTMPPNTNAMAYMMNAQNRGSYSNENSKDNKYPQNMPQMGVPMQQPNMGYMMRMNNVPPMMQNFNQMPR